MAGSTCTTEINDKNETAEMTTIYYTFPMTLIIDVQCDRTRLVRKCRIQMPEFQTDCSIYICQLGRVDVAKKICITSHTFCELEAEAKCFLKECLLFAFSILQLFRFYNSKAQVLVLGLGLGSAESLGSNWT